VIEARASKGGRVVLSDKRETAGAPAKIVVSADRTKIAADGQDVAVVNAMIVDAQGRPVPTAGNKVAFAVSGPGTVIGVGNGDPSCHEPDRATERSAFNGLCMAILQTKRGEPGPLSITLTSPGLDSATIAVASESSPLKPVAD
jgi:beta-galactosidase